MTDITTNLKARFCKDYKIPIKIYDEPYFSERLDLFDSLYDCKAKYHDFCEELKNYESEQDYFEKYTQIKEAMMDSIKNSKGYQEFNSPLTDVKWTYDYLEKISHNDIYKEQNVGKRYISVDMIQANFNVLKYYKRDIFSNCDTWEDFVRLFTDSEYIANSKYIREVVLGNCNPKRHINYERSLMGHIVDTSKLKDCNIVFFSNDEFIIDVTDKPNMKVNDGFSCLLDTTIVPLRIEEFTLKGVYNNKDIIGYIKDYGEKKTIKKYKSIYLPSIIRIILGQDIEENDLVFDYDGDICKLLNVTNFHIKG